MGRSVETVNCDSTGQWPVDLLDCEDGLSIEILDTPSNTIPCHQVELYMISTMPQDQIVQNDELHYHKLHSKLQNTRK